MFAFRIKVALLLVAMRVSAMPFSEVARLLPRTVTDIAVDEDAGQYLAFESDGTLYGTYPIDNSPTVQSERRAAGLCTQLSADDAKRLPGWSLIENHANEKYGKGSRNIVTNPPEYLDRPAHVCVNGDPIPVRMTDEPNCMAQNVEGQGIAVGTSGYVELEVTNGFKSESSLTVTQVATIGLSSTIGVQLGFEGVGDVSSSFTASAEITNEDTRTFSSSYSTEVKQKLRYEAPEGEMCHVNMDVSTCTLQVEGRIPYTADGFVWFNYNKRTKGHYKWAVNIETVVPNIEDRSSFLEFRGSATSNIHLNYTVECA
ncbi:hypothetical protein Moror_16151 [Moniliophthora roreri MCA 2997]|uniref:Uncharacterized protein n=1 Tax=Moniliophthora roreri (strain MCA 2997) TaxID=1381753 RepID=V2X6P0_MONRO|nr:hypothetical protein Moror_16151 [Moniliophthora roreri MCA 2997]KAI3608135.1 hypothetical protein WG66_006576 [Moniliophthora roreri]